MFARDFTELECVNDEADVAVLREPHPVVLEGRLIPIPSAAGVPTDVQNRGSFLAGGLWPVKVPGDIQPWATLEVQCLDHNVATIECTGGGGFQVGLLGQGFQPEHVEKLLLELWPFHLPLVLRLRPGQDHPADPLDLRGEVFVDQLVRGKFRLLGGKRYQGGAEAPCEGAGSGQLEEFAAIHGGPLGGCTELCSVGPGGARGTV